ncbi:MAG: dehydrogenase, partial [Alphaproteobacteria bacterium PA3]
LHFKYEDGLALWDALYALGVTPVGVETYANSRRVEKSLRLQNADLLTEYNLFECDLARPKVKAADFHGKAAHLKFREREQQPATLCTLVMSSNIDSHGVARYPLGNLPVMVPATGATLIASEGRRSFTPSIAFGPPLGKNIALAYLPHDYCQVGRELQIQYFADVYPVTVEAVGYRALYDAENVKPRS